MFERYLFRINIAVSIGIKSIKELKDLAVKFQQYEFANRISKIEQYLLGVEEELSPYKSPHPTLTRGLTPKGANFYKEIFTYAIHHHWKNLPKNFIALLKERKTELNELFEFDEASMYLLRNLNRRLNTLENDILCFLERHNENSDPVMSAALTIKCFSNGRFDTFANSSFNPNLAFYQIEFPLTYFLEGNVIYPGDDSKKFDFSSHLPTISNSQTYCLLFALLAKDGLLAWEDFMKIDRVEIDLDLRHSFSTDY